MTTSNTDVTTRFVDVAFLRCFDASLFASPILITAADEERLNALLIRLQDFGQILIPKVTMAESHLTFAGLVERLRSALGSAVVEAALATPPGTPLGSDPAPAAVMPVWAFELEGDDPEDEDVLFASGKLWGADVFIEALRVEGDDEAVPVPAVRHRFDRWVRADGGGRNRAATHLPGRTGTYVLFAAAAPT
jgi:hypothetical protein